LYSAAGSAAPSATIEAAAELDLDKLKRPRKEEAIADLFAPARVALTTVVKPGAGPPPAPTAPPLPFTYLGKIIDGDRMTVFIARGDEHYLVEAGQTIAGQYRVEQVTAEAVAFTYLPLGTRQILAVPALN